MDSQIFPIVNFSTARNEVLTAAVLLRNFLESIVEEFRSLVERSNSEFNKYCKFFFFLVEV